MAPSNVLAYLSQLSGNPSVQEDLDRSVRYARQACARARKAKDLKRATADRGVRVRARQSLRAARSAVDGIRRGPELERRRRRRRPVLVAGAALAGLTAAALYPDLQAHLGRPSSAEQR